MDVQNILKYYLELCAISPKKNHRDVIFANGSRYHINVFGSVVFVHKDRKMYRLITF